jgi:hypothetical protein
MFEWEHIFTPNKLLPPCNLRSSEMLQSENLFLVTDVSGQRVVAIFKRQAAQEEI